MEKSKSHRFELWQRHAALLILWDICAVNLSYFAALWLRFDLKFSEVPANYLDAWMTFTPIYTICCIGVFWFLKLYQSLWQYASYTELSRVLYATLLTTAVHWIGISWFLERMPLSYYVFGPFLQTALVAGIRFSYRFVLLLQARRLSNREEAGRTNVMIIGAGAAGQMLIRDIRKTREIRSNIACMIDDDSNKWGREIDGVPIVGGRESIPSAVEKYGIDKIYLAIPSVGATERREILEICKDTDCELKSLPGMYQLVSGQVTVNALKKVSVEDLLGREPVQEDMEEVNAFIRGKTVLVTGGGGSIGSELCRQVAAQCPKQLILLDIYENNAYEIQLELKEKYPRLDLQVLIASVRDSRRMQQIFATYRPQIVYHAAAHKHVPLMEDSPCEAVKNNAIGTYKTAFAAMLYGCERFVLISTDKAVNPTNIMGASKRLCEMIIQGFDYKIKAGKAHEIPRLFTHGELTEDEQGDSWKMYRKVKTQFVAVRFGNVLGSNGSVIPVFKKQIENGGPVTVTHPDIIRYFMTIREAVSLVMLAGTYANGGEIFVLDMGSPVKIDTLARNMIRLSGLKPDVDIPIQYTGLRPGEKLYEEKLMEEEGLKTTPSERIFIGSPIPFDMEEFLERLHELLRESYQNRDDIGELVQEIVTTYHPVPGAERRVMPLESAEARAQERKKAGHSDEEPLIKRVAK